MDFKMSTADEICKELAARVRCRRLALNVTQQDLAERVGVSLGTIKNFETKGQVGLTTLVTIAIVIDCAQDLSGLFISKEESIAMMERDERLRAKRRASRTLKSKKQSRS